MDVKYDSLRLENQLCFPVYLCSKEIVNKYNNLLKDVNLTYTQYIVMMYFWEYKKSNLKKLSNALLIDSSTLTPLLKKLENKNFIKRERNNNDERNLDLTITSDGEKLKDKVINIPNKIMKCVDLSYEEAEVLYNLTCKVIKNVRREKNENN